MLFFVYFGMLAAEERSKHHQQRTLVMFQQAAASGGFSLNSQGIKSSDDDHVIDIQECGGLMAARRTGTEEGSAAGLLQPQLSPLPFLIS